MLQGGGGSEGIWCRWDKPNPRRVDLTSGEMPGDPIVRAGLEGVYLYTGIILYIIYYYLYYIIRLLKLTCQPYTVYRTHYNIILLFFFVFYLLDLFIYVFFYPKNESVYYLYIVYTHCIRVSYVQYCYYYRIEVHVCLIIGTN